ncbi:major facilitator superfamily domain-containing protein [Peziza echinospora]|nr:major facilitator superfamily domain-containing protein [Peziza echinospora]
MTVLSTQSLDGLSVVEYERCYAGSEGGFSSDEEQEFEKGEQFVPIAEESEGGASWTQLGLIYSLHLAEAIVAASLQPQLYMLLRDDKICGSLNSVYWNGVIETVFALGSVAGLFWGWLGDRVGRRPVALAGMVGMAMSCFAMGFSTGLVSCIFIRGFAGLMGSSMRVMVWTMLGDVSDTQKAKARNFSRMPLVATGGIVGPLLQAVLANRFKDSEFWKTFPIMSAQLACAALMVGFLVVNYFFLKETLPEFDDQSATSDSGSIRGNEPYSDRFSGSSEYLNEKDTFLQHSNGGEYAQYTYTYNDKPKPLSFSHAIRAPSLIVLLTSFSFLALHSASFDQLLPILGNSSASDGGLGLPCSFLSVVVLAASITASVVVYLTFTRAINRVGLLPLYRICCWLFPLIYVLSPILSSVARSSTIAIAISATSSIFTKKIVTAFAQTLVVVLVTNASPDAYSMGSIMGLLHSAEAIRGVAVLLSAGVVGIMSSSTTTDASVRSTTIAANTLVWAVLGFGAVAGAGLAWFVKERAVVNRDWMASALKWEICYENESLVDEDEERRYGAGGRRGSTSSAGSNGSSELLWGSEYGGDQSDAESVVVV